MPNPTRMNQAMPSGTAGDPRRPSFMFGEDADAEEVAAALWADGEARGVGGELVSAVPAEGNRGDPRSPSPVGQDAQHYERSRRHKQNKDNDEHRSSDHR